MKKKIYLLCILGMVCFGSKAQKSKNIEFPKSTLNDTKAEKEMLEIVKGRPGFLVWDGKGIAEVKVLHMVSDEWWVSKDQYGQITGLNMRTTVGFSKENGDCYMVDVLFRKDYLGGGQYQQAPHPQKDYSTGKTVKIACATLDAVVLADSGTNGTTNQ